MSLEQKDIASSVGDMESTWKAFLKITKMCVGNLKIVQRLPSAVFWFNCVYVRDAADKLKYKYTFEKFCSNFSWYGEVPTIPTRKSDGHS